MGMATRSWDDFEAIRVWSESGARAELGSLVSDMGQGFMISYVQGQSWGQGERNMGALKLSVAARPFS